MPADNPIHKDLRYSAEVAPLEGSLQTGGGEEVKESEVASPGNRILAGYLAHEFLTKGTLFGRRFWMTGADESRSAKRARLECRDEQTPLLAKKNADVGKHKVYVEVASLLGKDGAHLPGIVNPSQLAMYLQTV